MARPLLWVAVLLALSIAADTRLLSFGKPVLRILFPQVHPTTWDLTVIFTTVAAVSAGVLTLLVSASMGLLQSAATRFPARALTYLNAERSRNILFGLLFSNFVFSLSYLVVTRTG